MRARPALAIPIALAAGTMIVAVLVLLTVVPQHDFSGRHLLPDSFTRVADDATLGSLIRRAQFDFVVAPVAGRRAFLRYEEGYTDGRHIYLAFSHNSSNTVIVYAFDSGTRTPLWKTERGSGGD